MLGKLKDRKGIAVIWVAIGMASILGFAVLALDLSAIQTARTQLQNAADAAALASILEEKEGLGTQIVKTVIGSPSSAD